MKQILIDTFNLIEAEAELFVNSFERISLLKGEPFIAHGKVCDKVGFVEKGLLKCTLIGQNKSVIDDFVFENQFVANHYSFLKQKPSNKEIICLEDSVLKIISRQKLNELSNKYPFVEIMARRVSEQLFLSTAEKLENMRLLSAEERYLRLLELNKQIFEKVPQYEIASYLNVSPETISRIRNKVASRS